MKKKQACADGGAVKGEGVRMQKRIAMGEKVTGMKTGGSMKPMMKPSGKKK